MPARQPPLPPAPGPKPAEFEFPFAEARAAQRAIEDMSDSLASLISSHRDAAASARVGWAGRARRSFDRSFSRAMGELASLRRQLDADALELGDAITTAETRRRSSLDSIAAWQRQKGSYDVAVAQAQAATQRR